MTSTIGTARLKSGMNSTGRKFKLSRVRTKLPSPVSFANPLIRKRIPSATRNNSMSQDFMLEPPSKRKPKPHLPGVSTHQAREIWASK
jgi:hypothetical protein